MAHTLLHYTLLSRCHLPLFCLLIQSIVEAPVSEVTGMTSLQPSVEAQMSEVTENDI